MSNKNIKIVCLPVAGINDPTQYLMIEGLNENIDIIAMNGVDDKFFGILRSAIKYQPDFLHFDWIECYYWRRNLVLTYLNFPIFFIQVMLCKYLFKIQIVWTIHNLLPHDRKYQHLKLRILSWFAKIVKSVRVLSPESISSVSELYKIPKSKIQFIGFGDYTKYYPNDINKEEARKKLNISATTKVLMTIGSVKEYKGIPEYLRAIQTLSKSNLNIYIVGKCVNKRLDAEIKSFVTSNTIYVNTFINSQDLQMYYNAADIIVLPFLDIENSGSVVMAMGFKKPVVAPQSHVLNERLKVQLNLLYKPGQLIQTLNTALAMSDKSLEEIGLNNYKQLEAYRWSDFGKLFFELKNGHVENTSK